MFGMTLPTTPRGFRDVLPYEASRRERIVEKVKDTFSVWGYHPVELPLLEDDEVLKMGGMLPSTPFKLFDRDGRLLVLRSDVTLPIARMAATKLVEPNVELRLRYTAPVFREQETFMGRSRQFTQLGIECIGKSGISADAEVLALLCATIEALKLQDAVVAVGSVKPLTALLEATGKDAAWQERVLDFFHRSDFVGYADFLSNEELDIPVKQALLELPRIKGEQSALVELEGLLAQAGCGSGVVSYLQDVLAAVRGRGMTTTIIFDFSVMSSFDYYSGIVFDAFVPGVGSSLGGGGRYDNALEKFGVGAPAAGFALSLEAIQAARYAQNDTSEYKEKELLLLAGAQLSDVARFARETRAQGIPCIISAKVGLKVGDEELTKEAHRCGAAFVVTIAGDKVTKREVGVQDAGEEN